LVERLVVGLLLLFAHIVVKMGTPHITLITRDLDPIAPNLVSVHSRWELNLPGEELLHLLKLLKIQKRRTSASKRAEVTRRRELVDHRYLHLLMHHIPTLIMTANLPPLSGHSALSGHQWSGHQLELENALHGRIWSRTTRRRNVAIPYRILLRMREICDRENVSEAAAGELLRVNVVLRGDGRAFRSSPYIHDLVHHIPYILYHSIVPDLLGLPCLWCEQDNVEQE
jgi:hypothetical protein